MSFVTIFDKKIVTTNNFSHLRQVEKWGFSSSNYIKYQINKISNNKIIALIQKLTQ
jgi:hypothetical protein